LVDQTPDDKKPSLTDRILTLTGENTRLATDLDDARKRAEQLEYDKDVLRRVMHDLNNTIFAAVASLEMRDFRKDHEDGLSEEDDEAFIRAARRSLEHACQLHKYGQAALRHERPSHHPQMTGITEMVEAVMSMCGGLFEAKKIEARMRKAYEGPDLHFYGDQPRFVSILLNIFTNATRALENTKDPRIEVTVAKQAKDGREYISLEVYNNGPDMPFKDAEEAFQEGKSGTGSTGIGLAISRYLLENYFKGSIYARQRPEVEGVSFRIELPLWTQEAAQNLNK
jgi:signal transduction histidine kinase